MKPEKPKKLGFRKIYYNLDKILFLFFLIFMMVEFVWLPLNSWIAGILLRQTGYLFISYNNFWEVGGPSGLRKTIHGTTPWVTERHG